MAAIETLMFSDATIILKGLATADEPVDSRLRLRYNLAASKHFMGWAPWAKAGKSGIVHVIASGRLWRAVYDGHKRSFKTKSAAFDYICDIERKRGAMPDMPAELPDPAGCAWLRLLGIELI